SSSRPRPVARGRSLCRRSRRLPRRQGCTRPEPSTRAGTGRPPASSRRRTGADRSLRAEPVPGADCDPVRVASMAASPLELGVLAPDFTLKDQNGVDVTLSSFRRSPDGSTAGKNVLLVFYPFAFSGICTGELHEIRDDLGSFVDDDVQVLTISCDPMFSLRGWADL